MRLPVESPVEADRLTIRSCVALPAQVFHELSRHLQTRRLIAGDSLSLDSDDKSFYCVVDG